MDRALPYSRPTRYRVIQEYVDYFNRSRPLQGIEQRIPEGPRDGESERRSGQIICFPVLGGLHSSFHDHLVVQPGQAASLAVGHDDNVLDSNSKAICEINPRLDRENHAGL